jgi:hypothetical protein
VKKQPQRKRLITRLYDTLDQIDTLMLDAEKKPSVLKAAVTKAEILAALLRRDDAEKERKAAAKAAALATPVTPAQAPATLSAEQLIAHVAERKRKLEEERPNGNN